MDTGILSIGEGHLFHRGSTVQWGGRGGYFTKSGGVFQSFLRENTNLPLTNNTEGVTLNLMNALFVTTTTTTTTTAIGGPRGGCAL
jgi:hypothetical protein